MTNFGFSDEDQVDHLGINGKMSEASAAMGLASLATLDAVDEHNRANHAAYARGLAGVPGVRLHGPAPEDEGKCERRNHHYVVTEVGPEAGLRRDELVAALRLENVVARRYFHPGCHRMAPYRDLEPHAGRALAATEALCERVMVLPTGQALGTPDVERLCARIAAAVARAGEVRAALRISRDPRLPRFLAG
jgi:dTDP-4-amino-4,6-dideoxygalactose transaminase